MLGHDVADSRVGEWPDAREQCAGLGCANEFCMIPMAGLEPARPFGLRILSPLRLPFRHIGIVDSEIIRRESGSVKQRIS